MEGRLAGGSGMTGAGAIGWAGGVAGSGRFRRRAAATRKTTTTIATTRPRYITVLCCSRQSARVRQC